MSWLKLHRQIRDSDLWLSEPFSRGQAWVDLLALANYRDGSIRVRGQRIAIPVGSVGMSVVKLAERWQWSRGKTIRFLNELEMEQQIVQQKNNLSSVIAITNWDQYQGNGTASSTTDSTTDGTTDGTLYKKNKKKEKNTVHRDKVIPTAPPEAISIMEFPVSGKEVRWSLTQDQLGKWEANFPLVDIEAECLRAKGWIEANPAKTKTHRGMTKFLYGWISRSVDRGKAQIKNGGLANAELAEPEGWADTLKKLKTDNPKDEDLYRSNPNHRWSDLTKSVQSLINHNKNK